MILPKELLSINPSMRFIYLIMDTQIRWVPFRICFLDLNILMPTLNINLIQWMLRVIEGFAPDTI